MDPSGNRNSFPPEWNIRLADRCLHQTGSRVVLTQLHAQTFRRTDPVAVFALHHIAAGRLAGLGVAARGTAGTSVWRVGGHL